MPRHEEELPVQHFIAQYGYLAVFLLMLAESACIPIPSEVVMLFGGALSAGAVPGAHPALAGIVVAGAAGNVAGSFLAWAAAPSRPTAPHPADDPRSQA